MDLCLHLGTPWNVILGGSRIMGGRWEHFCPLHTLNTSEATGNPAHRQPSRWGSEMSAARGWGWGNGAEFPPLPLKLQQPWIPSACVKGDPLVGAGASRLGGCGKTQYNVLGPRDLRRPELCSCAPSVAHNQAVLLQPHTTRSTGLTRTPGNALP